MSNPLPLRVALIGLGRQGQQHWKCLQKLHRQGQIEVVAGCDVIPSTILGEIPFFNDYHQLLASSKPQVVIVAVPNHLHQKIAVAAIEAGCDVVKEKPLATTLKAGQALIKKARSLDRLVLTTQHRYHQELVTKTKEQLRWLGTISYFSYSFSLNDQNQSWYWDIERAGGGSWLNLGWHGLSLIQWLLGDIAEVQLAWNSGGKRDWEYQTDHTALAHLTLASGATGSLFVSCVQPKDESLLIEGTHGSIHLTRHHVLISRDEKTSTFPVTQTQDQAYDLMYQQLFRSVVSRNYQMENDLKILTAIDRGLSSLTK